MQESTMPYLRIEHEAESNHQETNASTLSVKPITVLVVDDHVLILSVINQILSLEPEIRQVITVQDYIEAEIQTARLCPDVIWLDMHISHKDSIEEISRLRKLSPQSRIVAVADEENEKEAFAAIMTGAQGYRSKQDVDPGEIMSIIRMVCRGEFVLRPLLMTRLMLRLRDAAIPLWDSENGPGHHALLHNNEFNGLATLTTREREILQLISQGYRDRDIAQGLHISEKTVQKHVQSILSKLGAQNRTEAAYYLIHTDHFREVQ
jgi:two-component system, NarL family, response regulator DevR